MLEGTRSKNNVFTRIKLKKIYLCLPKVTPLVNSRKGGPHTKPLKNSIEEAEMAPHVA
jgi:hypothetical protein